MITKRNMQDPNDFTIVETAEEATDIEQAEITEDKEIDKTGGEVALCLDDPDCEDCEATCDGSELFKILKKKS